MKQGIIGFVKVNKCVHNRRRTQKNQYLINRQRWLFKIIIIIITIIVILFLFYYFGKRYLRWWFGESARTSFLSLVIYFSGK